MQCCRWFLIVNYWGTRRSAMIVFPICISFHPKISPLPKHSSSKMAVRLALHTIAYNRVRSLGLALAWVMLDVPCSSGLMPPSRDCLAEGDWQLWTLFQVIHHPGNWHTLLFLGHSSSLLVSWRLILLKNSVMHHKTSSEEVRGSWDVLSCFQKSAWQAIYPCSHRKQQKGREGGKVEGPTPPPRAILDPYTVCVSSSSEAALFLGQLFYIVGGLLIVICRVVLSMRLTKVII